MENVMCNVLAVNITESRKDGKGIYESASYAWPIDAKKAKNINWILAVEDNKPVGIFNVELINCADPKAKKPHWVSKEDWDKNVKDGRWYFDTKKTDGQLSDFPLIMYLDNKMEA